MTQSTETHSELVDVKCPFCSEELMLVANKDPYKGKYNISTKFVYSGVLLCAKCFFTLPYYNEELKNKKKRFELVSADDAEILYQLCYNADSQYMQFLNKIIEFNESTKGCVRCSNEKKLYKNKWFYYCVECRTEIPINPTSVKRLMEEEQGFDQNFDKYVLMGPRQLKDYSESIESMKRLMFFLGIHKDKNLVVVK